MDLLDYNYKHADRMIAVILLGVLCLAGCGDSSEPTESDATQDAVWKQQQTVEEAALEFFCQGGGVLGKHPNIDREKTLALWRKQIQRSKSDEIFPSPIRWEGDLNGDGLVDCVFNIRNVCETGGEIMSYSGATGNTTWIMLAGDSAGGYRMVADGTGFCPHILRTSHNGWRDYIVGGTMAGSTVRLFMQFMTAGNIPPPGREPDTSATDTGTSGWLRQFCRKH